MWFPVGGIMRIRFRIIFSLVSNWDRSACDVISIFQMLLSIKANISFFACQRIRESLYLGQAVLFKQSFHGRFLPFIPWFLQIYDTRSISVIFFILFSKNGKLCWNLYLKFHIIFNIINWKNFSKNFNSLWKADRKVKNFF